MRRIGLRSGPATAPVYPDLARKVVLVTRRTRLEDLIAKFLTADQARFYVEHLGADFSDYEREHAAYQAARLTSPTDQMNARQGRMPEIGKFRTARWVCTP